MNLRQDTKVAYSGKISYFSCCVFGMANCIHNLYANDILMSI
jgi:hypothetical protein